MGVDMQDKANQRKLAKALIPYSNDQEALNRLTMYLSVTLKEMDDLDDALAVAVEELENDVNSGETEKSSRPRGQ